MAALRRYLTVLMFLIVGSPSVFSSVPPRCDVLLVAYDVGDLNALKALAGTLAHRNRQSCFFAVGQAAVQLNQDPRVVFKELGLGGSQAWPRTRILDEDDLAQLQTLHPKVIVTGMASALQAQLLTLTEHAYAYYDNFDSVVGKEYIQAFLDQTKCTGSPSAYWAPSQTTADTFANDPRTKDSPVSVVGQPVLEEWETLFETTDRQALRAKLGVEAGRRVILFAGGYDETYASYVSLFVSSIKDLVDELNLEVLITYHPKPGGVIERELVAKANNPHIRVIDGESQGGVATNKIAIIADVFVCHKSSMGPQAISQGLPMLYVADPQDYKNIVLDEGLAHIAGTKEAVQFNVRALLEGKAFVSLENLGLPKNPASHVMADLVQKVVEN